MSVYWFIQVKRLAVWTQIILLLENQSNLDLHFVGEASNISADDKSIVRLFVMCALRVH